MESREFLKPQVTDLFLAYLKTLAEKFRPSWILACCLVSGCWPTPPDHLQGAGLSQHSSPGGRVDPPWVLQVFPDGKPFIFSQVVRGRSGSQGGGGFSVCQILFFCLFHMVEVFFLIIFLSILSIFNFSVIFHHISECFFFHWKTTLKMILRKTLCFLKWEMFSWRKNSKLKIKLWKNSCDIFLN